MENPIKMDDLEVPLFLETPRPICIYLTDCGKILMAQFTFFSDTYKMGDTRISVP